MEVDGVANAKEGKRVANALEQGTNKEIKTLLHLCATSVISMKGELQDYFYRKVAEGKNKMLVINAIRNKLILRIFACVKRETLYKKNYQYPLG